MNPCNIFNTRVRAKMYLKRTLKEGNSLAVFFSHSSSKTNLSLSLDNITTDIMDEAIVSIEDIFIENLNDDTCNMCLFAMLDTLRSKSSGFTYSLCHDINGKLSGVVWMTAFMRSDFEKISSNICVDAMKRKTNISLFAYMSIVVTDDMNKVQVCCESLILREKHEVYKFILNSAFDMAPKVERYKIKCIFVMNSSHIQFFRVVNCHVLKSSTIITIWI